MPSPKIPIVTDVLEQCQTTLNGLALWKTKEVLLTIDNWQEHLFVLTTDLAAYFGMRHNNFINQNIRKLSKEGYLSDQLHKYKQLIPKGNLAQVSQKVYALNSNEIAVVAASLLAGKFYDKKLALLIRLQEMTKGISQIVDLENVTEEIEENPTSFPILTDVLEKYGTTDEGIQLWKTKGLSLNLSNVLDNVFVLSHDLAQYFSIRHNNLVNQNIAKLQNEKYFPDHLLKIKHMVAIGSDAKRAQVLYGLTRHQTYCLIMDLAGPKARRKKYQIIVRLERLEIAVLQGSYEQARAQVLDWDGVTLLKEFGFKFSLEQENIATRKDILDFLQLPTATLTNFLQRNSHQITPIKLNHEQRLAAGIKCSRLCGYSADDVLKTVFWLDSPMGVKIKQTMFGKVSLYARPDTNHETSWHSIFLVVFKGFGLYHNFLIGKYKADFYVAKLRIILECDENLHKHYDQQKEAEREKWLLQQGYAIVRFDSKVDLQTLFNGILQAKPGKLVKVSCAD